MPREAIHSNANSVPGNGSTGSSLSVGSRQGRIHEDRVIRRERSRNLQKMYQPKQKFYPGASSSSRVQPELNQFRCIEKTLIEGPVMPSLTTCPVHNPYELSNSSMPTPSPPAQPHPPQLRPSVVYWGYGPIAAQHFGRMVPAPWNSSINEGPDFQRHQRSDVPSIIDLDCIADQQATTPYVFEVPETLCLPEFQTGNLQDFSQEVHNQWTGIASTMRSNSPVRGQGIQITSTLASPKASMSYDEVLEVTQDGDNQQLRNLEATIMASSLEIEHPCDPAKLERYVEEFKALLPQNPLQTDHNKKAFEISPFIASSYSGQGPSNFQSTTAKSEMSGYHAFKKHEEGVRTTQELPNSDDDAGLGNEGIRNMHLEIEPSVGITDQFIAEEDFSELVGWSDYQLMGNTDRFGFDI